MSSASPYEGLQQFVEQLPEVVQPLVVGVLGTIPYVEGEGSAAIGVILGIHPVVAAIAGAAGNFLAVLLVVLLGSRVRAFVVARRSARAVARDREVVTAGGDSAAAPAPAASGDRPASGRHGKGRARLRRWLLRFGVPGASILAPFALPTHVTAAFFVASGVRKGWVLLWQAVAIVLWTSLVAAAALGLVSALGWNA